MSDDKPLRVYALVTVPFEISIQDLYNKVKFKFTDSYLDKAKIYTWLAWQEEPGRQLYQAIKYQILNPQHPKAQTFVTWFKTLYDL